MSTNEEVTWKQLVLDGVRAHLIMLWMGLCAAVRACLPVGMLPRKAVAGEIVLVTGAGSGIGRMMAQRFAELGARLVLWDVDAAGNEQTAANIRLLDADVHTFTVDLSDRHAVYQAAERVKSEVGEVDILINNAGIVTGRRFLDCPDELIVKTFQVNTIAHFWTVKAFLPSMLRRNHGHLVSVASAAGLFPGPNLADYCASKFAAVGFNESLAVELSGRGADNVHTTTVCPFYINTGMFDGVVSGSALFQILEPDLAVARIMDAVLTNQPMLIMPRILYVMYFLRGLLPNKLGLFIGDYFGVTRSMDHFKGRQPTK